MNRPEFRNQYNIIGEIIRVNHAGEYGAIQIYLGQIEKTIDPTIKSIIQDMYNGEKIHLKYFEEQIIKRSTRPTIMIPIWRLLGRSLGKISSILGVKTSMLLTDSVESVIDEHYKKQLEYLSKIKCEKDLSDHIEKFRQEELHHKEIAIENGSINSPFYHSLNNMIKYGCNIAIRLSKRI
jgi:ubiquinone biosynthesis monooxygenase Coq7